VKLRSLKGNSIHKISIKALDEGVILDQIKVWDFSPTNKK